MSRIFVLGHRGMLGHLVVAFLRQSGHEVVTSDHRYGGTGKEPLLEAVRQSGCPWVINALGAIPQKVEDAGTLFRANMQLPLHLLEYLGDGQRLIHASSDCVFAGRKGGYHTSDFKDAENAYGLSKALGEAVALDPRVHCLRVSIIGPDLGGGRGLLAWFLQQQGTVNGYTNHFWNGITTLEWAKAALDIINGTSTIPPGVTQLGVAEIVSKYDLLQLFAEVWGTGVEVRATSTPETVDRTLVPDVPSQALREQLVELREWMRVTQNGN